MSLSITVAMRADAVWTPWTRKTVWTGTLAAAIALGGVSLASAQSPSDVSLSAAAKDFADYCAPCHGAGGKGDGSIATRLNMQPANLTRIAEHAGGTFPAEAVYDKIEGLSMPDAHGSREMPVWGDVFVTQAVGTTTSLAEARAAAHRAHDRIQALVDYLRTIQAGR